MIQPEKKFVENLKERNSVTRIVRRPGNRMKRLQNHISKKSYC